MAVTAAVSAEAETAGVAVAGRRTAAALIERNGVNSDRLKLK